jgi:hypothetical protein
VFGGIQIVTPNQQQKSSDVEKLPGSRRSSFRIPAQDDFEKDDSPSPDNGPTLLIDDDRRIRRRGSQLLVSCATRTITMPYLNLGKFNLFSLEIFLNLNKQPRYFGTA